MSIFGKILKKKAELKPEKKEESSFIKTSVDKKALADKSEGREKPKSSGGKIIIGVLRAPHITEKSTAAAKENKYVFSVAPRVNKAEIKRAVEARYGVEVKAVNMLNMPGKERRRGRIIGWKPGIRKAVVTLKEGQTIEFT